MLLLMVIALCLLIAGGLTACTYQFVAPNLFDYQIHPDRIQFVAFGLLPLGHIRLRDITDIRKVSFIESFGLARFSLHNRVLGPRLLITKNRGLFRSVLITPANPDEFIETVTRNRLSSSPDHILAHDHSMRNRDEILASELCGCFYCTSVFAPSTVVDWVKDEGGDTAICPKCGIDSVLGDRAGYPLSGA